MGIFVDGSFSLWLSKLSNAKLSSHTVLFLSHRGKAVEDKNCMEVKQTEENQLIDKF